MYWNIFDKVRYELLKKISEVVSINDYYMVGGTALSLSFKWCSSQFFLLS